MVISVKGPHSGPKAAVKAFAKDRNAKRLEEVYAFIDQLYSQDIFDAFMICAQSSHETTSWTDDKWNRFLNPGGIGVTGSGNVGDIDYGYVFKNGAEAAKAMLIHHCAYTGTEVPDSWKSWIPLDPRYKAVFDAGYNGKITNWEDYGNGYWATDPNYYRGIMNHVSLINQYEGEKNTPPISEGTMPNIIDKWLHVAQDGYAAVNRRYIGRGGMAPKTIFLHIQEGNNWGSWTWFHVVTASCTVMVAKNGDIWRVVPESDGPWTSGDVSNPTAKGREIINAYGSDPNYYSLTIETEGFTGEWPKDQAQLDSVVWQIKTWMKTYNIPLDRVLRHADVNQTSRPQCPGDAYYNYIIGRIRTEGTKDTPVTTKYATPNAIMVDGKKWDGTKDVTINKTIFRGQQTAGIETIDNAVVHLYATKDSLPTRSNMKKGTTFGALGFVEGQKIGDESRWWITKNFGRVWVGNTKQKPKTNDVRVAEEETGEELPSGVKLLNGRVYYPVREDEKMERELTLSKDASLYKSATNRSEVVGTLSKGQKAIAVYYTVGDEHQGESIWYVLKEGNKDPLTQGPRINAFYTTERPD